MNQTNMEIKEAIYGYDGIICNLKESIEKHIEISQKNKALILEYHNNGIARGLTKARQTIILESLKRLALSFKYTF